MRDLLIECDSLLSLIRHRELLGLSAQTTREVDRLLARLRPITNALARGSGSEAKAITVDALLAACYDVESVHHFHGDECLCGFSSSRSRSRTEHITETLRSFLLPEAQR